MKKNRNDKTNSNYSGAASDGPYGDEQRAQLTWIFSEDPLIDVIASHEERQKKQLSSDELVILKRLSPNNPLLELWLPSDIVHFQEWAAKAKKKQLPRQADINLLEGPTEYANSPIDLDAFPVVFDVPTVEFLLGVLHSGAVEAFPLSGIDGAAVVIETIKSFENNSDAAYFCLRDVAEVVQLRVRRKFRALN